MLNRAQLLTTREKRRPLTRKKLCNSLGGKTGLHHLGIFTKDAEELIKQFKQQFNVDTAQVRKLGNLG